MDWIEVRKGVGRLNEVYGRCLDLKKCDFYDGGGNYDREKLMGFGGWSKRISWWIGCGLMREKRN